jgi:type III restriction enzyme
MAGLELFGFQDTAADTILEEAIAYFRRGGDIIGGRKIPFVTQLRAVTGAGKTPILASAIGRLRPSIVLWTTKYGSVVDQTALNLAVGGKYHHLLGLSSVEVIKFADIPSSAAWSRILEQRDGLTVLVSTVAAWFSSEKDERLNVHRIHPDWGDKSRWDQLKADRKRPLWVVYDEAHNTTTEQVELLDDLLPAGFLIASASPVKGRLQQYLSLIGDEERKRRIISIRTRAVVDAELLKSAISVADYDSPTDDMLRDVVQGREHLAQRLTEIGSPTVPKAIYVVESSSTRKGAEARPIAIWRTLTTHCGIPIDNVAICTNTKELPKDAIHVKKISELLEHHTHIIFNKKLQEGWDDPAVFICYFDGETDSATRMQQVIGRALRQPGGHHFADEELNTAYFFINCPNEALDRIIDDLKQELQIYKDDEDPEEFEPFQIKVQRKALLRIPIKPESEGKLTVRRLQLELPSPEVLGKLLRKRIISLSDDDRAAAGRAMINIVCMKTGDVEQQTIDLLEDMRVPCGTYLQDQIRSLSKSCLNAMNPSLFADDKLADTACYKSKALDYYKDLAVQLVREYENHVQLQELADPLERDYIVGSYQPWGSVKKSFDHAAHPHYDAKSFNNDELEFAKALDRYDYVWVRNKEKVDYGIPLPIKSGTSTQFFPDFLWWIRIKPDRHVIWAIDTTGRFIIDEKVRTKLLTVPEPLRIALVVRGKLNSTYREIGQDGWTLLRFRLGNASPETFDALDDLLITLIRESKGGR